MKCSHTYTNKLSNGLLECRACGFTSEAKYMHDTRNRLMQDSQHLRATCDHLSVSPHNGVMACDRCGEQWASKMDLILSEGVKARLRAIGTVTAKPVDTRPIATAKAKNQEVARWLSDKRIVLKLA